MTPDPLLKIPPRNSQRARRALSLIEPFAIALAACITLAFFLRFAWPGLYAYFSHDDVMNLYYYWSRPTSRLLQSNIFFATDYYRPMGGLFYLGTYTLAGFRPFAFHAIALALLVANMFLFYFAVRRLAGSRQVAMLAVLLSAFHASAIDLYFDTGMIYDVLCYVFYFGALVLYLRVRQQERLPGRFETVGILALYVACINSKEMGISLPILILVYELLWHPPRGIAWGALTKWVRNEGRFSLILAGFTVAFIIGKAFGPESLANHPAYKPDVSLAKYLSSYAYYLNLLFYERDFFNPSRAAALLGAMVLLAALLRRRREIGWSAALAIFGILPIAFVLPRNGFAMYVPGAGWSLFLAAMVVAGKDALCWLIFRVGERWVSASRGSDSRRAVSAGMWMILFLAAASSLYSAHEKYVQYPMPFMKAKGEAIRLPASQIGALIPKLEGPSRLLFLDDSFPADSWDLDFTVLLYYNNHHIELHRAKKMTAAPSTAEMAAYDYVLGYRDGQYSLVQSKAVRRR